MAGKASGEKTFFESDFVKNILIWFFQIAVVLACAVVVAIFFFQSVTMQEGSMEPTLAAGERFFINKMAYKLGSPGGTSLSLKPAPRRRPPCRLSG